MSERDFEKMMTLMVSMKEEIKTYQEMEEEQADSETYH